MKHIGNVAEYRDQKNNELLARFAEQFRNGSYRDMNDLFSKTASMPATRFFIGEQRALVIVKRLMRGESLGRMLSSRRRMYLDIYSRVCAVMRDNPECTLTNAVFQVVNSQAPEFYMTRESARTTIYRLRREKAGRNVMPHNPFSTSPHKNC